MSEKIAKELFYDKLSDEDKNLLPLQPIYFLGTSD